MFGVFWVVGIFFVSDGFGYYVKVCWSDIAVIGIEHVIGKKQRYLLLRGFTFPSLLIIKVIPAVLIERIDEK